MKKAGFTLLELLVVVAIIGLLAAIIIANLSQARNRALVVKTVEETQQLQTALELYKADHDNLYPLEGDNPNLNFYSPSGSGGFIYTLPFFITLLDPYVDLNELKLINDPIPFNSDLHYYPPYSTYFYGPDNSAQDLRCGLEKPPRGSYLVTFESDLPNMTMPKLSYGTISIFYNTYCFVAK